MEHICEHEKDFGAITEVVKGLVKQVYGNGQPGFAQTVPELSGKIDNLTNIIENLRSAVSGVVRFEAEHAGMDKYKHSEGMSARQRTQIAISAIIGVAAIVTTIILKFA